MSDDRIEKQVIYDGRKVHLEVHHMHAPDGTPLKREVVVHPGAVTMLAFLNSDTILLIRNHRYSVRQYLVELPAGTLEKGEAPMNAAGRELEEETGYLAGRLERLAEYFTSPGILTERMYSFAAYDLIATQRHLEKDEEIEVLPTRFEDAIQMIRDGQIQDAKTIATLLLYKQFHPRI